MVSARWRDLPDDKQFLSGSFTDSTSCAMVVESVGCSSLMRHLGGERVNKQTFIQVAVIQGCFDK